MLAEKINLEADEVVLTQVRKHWFVITMQIVSLVFAGIAPAVLYITFLILAGDTLRATASLYWQHMLFVYIVWLSFLWMGAFNLWTNYFLDVWTITNRRVIAVDQRGFFSRTIGSFRLERLQDLNIEVNGILATMLNYGTLEAQTAAGSEDEFKATGLPNPDELKSIILSAADKLMDEYRHRPPLTHISEDVV